MTNANVNLSEAMKAVDSELNREANIDHAGAAAANFILECMWIFQGRTRMVGEDFKAMRLVHRAGVAVASASVAEHRTDPVERLAVNPSTILNAMDKALNDAEASKQAAQ